ncbi:MAG: ParB/RepB/Spo0J family partition protein [Desulfobacterales bacterium]|jgi:ParB family chromosome partitioning protein
MDSKPPNGCQRSQNASLGPVAHTDTVLLADIDKKDKTYRITTRKQLKNLQGSILALGLLHPPMLIEYSSGYRIVCGFRRISACRQLGWTSIAARIHSADANRFEIAQLAIADNALQRPLNLVETSRALNLLVETSPDQQQLSKALVLLGLPTSSSVASKIQQICRLPQPIQNGILSDTINLSIALELGKLDEGDATALVRLFNQLKVGLNKQRELLLLLSEIAKREDIPIQQLIAEKPLQHILQNKDLDRAVQRQKVRSHLRYRRYPTLSKAEAAYQKHVQRLKLGKYIQLVAPRDFEGTTYAMTLHFKNRKDLSHLKEKIQSILDHPALGEILKR